MAQIRLIGTDPSQVPTNGMLGSLAFQSAESVSIGIVGVDKGVVSLPSITFIGDTNTGIFSPGADQLAISTNGTGRLFVDANGNVDIASSSQALTLLNLNALTTGNAAIRFNDTTANIGNINYNFTDDALTFRVNAGERLRITSIGTVNIVGAGTAGSTQAVSFNGSAPANSLVLDSNGRVGIGNPTPAEKLDVFGRFRLFDGGYPYIDIGISTSNYFRLIHDNPNDRFYIGKNNNPTLVITGGNHVEPGADAAQNFGSAAKRWANIYSADLQLSNEGSANGNEIDGTWGSYTIQEGEEALYLINRRSGKKFKFILEEVE